MTHHILKFLDQRIEGIQRISKDRRSTRALSAALVSSRTDSSINEDEFNSTSGLMTTNSDKSPAFKAWLKSPSDISSSSQSASKDGRVYRLALPSTWPVTPLKSVYSVSLLSLCDCTDAWRLTVATWHPGRLFDETLHPSGVRTIVSPWLLLVLVRSIRALMSLPTLSVVPSQHAVTRYHNE